MYYKTWLLTCLSLLPTVISDIRHIIVLHTFLNLMQSRALKLRLEISRDIVVDTQVFCLPFYGLTRGPGGDGGNTSRCENTEMHLFPTYVAAWRCFIRIRFTVTPGMSGLCQLFIVHVKKAWRWILSSCQCYDITCSTDVKWMWHTVVIRGFSKEKRKMFASVYVRSRVEAVGWRGNHHLAQYWH